MPRQTPPCVNSAEGQHADRVCEEHGIEHRLTKVDHPWTNGQVERMNRTIKETTVKRYYERHDQLKEHKEQALWLCATAAPSRRSGVRRYSERAIPRETQ